MNACPECGSDNLMPYDTGYKVGGWSGLLCGACGYEIDSELYELGDTATGTVAVSREDFEYLIELVTFSLPEGRLGEDLDAETATWRREFLMRMNEVLDEALRLTPGEPDRTHARVAGCPGSPECQAGHHGCPQYLPEADPQT